MKWVLLVVTIVLAAAVAALAWLVVVYPTQPPPTGPVRTVALQLQPQLSLDAAAEQLARAGLVKQPRVFALYARVLGAQKRLRSGQVLVTSQMTIRHLLQRIAEGYGSTPLLITIPEGWTQFDVAQRLAEWGVCDSGTFLQTIAPGAADASAPAVGAAPRGEGYLFPDTYWLRDGMHADQVIAKLSDNAQRRMNKLFAAEPAALARLHADFGYGQSEIVVLASIVEKEAHVPEEQPMIAGVFLNRLRDPSFHPKRLQADPTVAYGCLLHRELPSCSTFDGRRVTRTMTADPQNPYNTYRIEGLPPTPIANPGISALRAVLHPAEHSYLYFVARGDGHHTFSANLEAHNLATRLAVNPGVP